MTKLATAGCVAREGGASADLIQGTSPKRTALRAGCNRTGSAHEAVASESRKIVRLDRAAYAGPEGCRRVRR